MQKSELELVASEMTDWQEAVDWHDEHGWDSLDEERDALVILIDAKQRMAQLSGTTEVPELLALRQRLEELEQEIATDEQKGQKWAESVRIKIGSIDSDIIERAARYFGSPQGYNGVLAFCRHRCTNYEDLLKEADRFSGRPHDIIKSRVYASVEEALKQVGVDEMSFLDMGENEN